MIFYSLHILLLLLFPPLLLGVINKVKAVFAGRHGAPVVQPYYTIAKLLRKNMVFSSTTTWVFRTAPIINLAAVLLAGLFIPLGSSSALISFTGDFILFTYLFGLARFFTTSAALDTGSAFEGMGAAREVSFSVLTEPAQFFAFLVLIKISGSFSLSGMLQAGNPFPFQSGNTTPLIMIIAGLFIILLAESSRIPVDDPNTHLELTMIHEVMILDHSGPLLGLIEYASAVKLFILGSLLINILIPYTFGTQGLDLLIHAAGMIGLSIIIGILESVMARLRMFRISALLVTAILLCGSAFILLLR